MPLVKFSKVTTMLVFVVIMILMSSELASAAFDSIPIFKLADVGGTSASEECDPCPFDKGHKVMVPKVTDKSACPPRGYVAISPHHLHTGLRFLLSKFLIRVLKLLRLASMQLTPNSFVQLIFFYLTFRRREVVRSTVLRFAKRRN
ncbi:hypothetical protein ACOSQ4_009765 [Xanthoceras sorbifolium]